MFWGASVRGANAGGANVGGASVAGASVEAQKSRYADWNWLKYNPFRKRTLCIAHWTGFGDRGLDVSLFLFGIEWWAWCQGWWVLLLSSPPPFIQKFLRFLGLKFITNGRTAFAFLLFPKLLIKCSLELQLWLSRYSHIRDFIFKFEKDESMLTLDASKSSDYRIFFILLAVSCGRRKPCSCAMNYYTLP
jgi:hypothetical protein